METRFRISKKNEDLAIIREICYHYLIEAQGPYSILKDMKTTNFNTLSEAVYSLTKEGFAEDFKGKEKYIMALCSEKNSCLKLSKF